MLTKLKSKLHLGVLALLGLLAWVAYLLGKNDKTLRTLARKKLEIEYMESKREISTTGTKSAAAIERYKRLRDERRRADDTTPNV